MGPPAVTAAANIGPTPRGFRIGNPCLVRKSSIAWRGEIPGDRRRLRVLRQSRGRRPRRRPQLSHALAPRRPHGPALIERHAPAVENPVEEYVGFVAARCAVTPDSPVDLTNLCFLERFIAAVIAFECDRWAVPVETLRRGCTRALGTA